MFTAVLLLIFGFALLIKGADFLVDGASAIARRLGIRELVIGLTIVAFGTSMPEFVVSSLAALQNNTEIAIGNIVGSNIANTLLILGSSSLIAPLVVQSSTVRKEIPFALLSSVILFVLANDRLIDGYVLSELGRGDGWVFIGFFVIFLYYTFGMGKADQVEDEKAEKSMPIWQSALRIVAGLAALMIGGKLSVDGAVRIATDLGVSQTLIGLTIVAVGTSLPELFTSVIAAMRGKADIAIGNIVGSNIFNILWILGFSALIRPLPVQEDMNFDLLVAIATTLFLFLLVHTGHVHRRLFLWWKQREHFNLRRFEGAMLLAAYAIYIGFIAWRG